tara:strand:+ start:1069 stop:2076 length:1008 start_codon:yes stop_codon:yes gene_type:complete
MNTIDTLGVNTLALRGKGVEFNKFSRFFKTIEDGEEAVATGDYVPTPGQVNAVLVLGGGIMIWSFDLNEFVSIADFAAAGNQASRYIELDGANDYVKFDEPSGAASDVMDLTKDWTIGITLVGLTGPSSAKKFNLFSRGGFNITLNAQAGSTNWGLYVTSDNDLYNADKRAQANTWYAPTPFSRILFTYNAATKRLKYFLGDPAAGTYAQRANLAIPQTMVDGQNITGELSIGKAWSGVGGAGFSGYNWDGGVNNMIASDVEFTGPQLTEYFQDQSGDPDNPSDSFSNAEFYPDLVAYAKLGEDTYPEVVDTLGNLTNGALVDGAADDFKDIPTE